MNEILYAAKLTALVYNGNDIGAKSWVDTLDELGIDNTKAVLNHNTGTEAFICVSSAKKLINIVVRGSEAPSSWSGLQDWFNNFLSVKISFYGIRAHAGYARAALSVIDQIIALISTLPSDYRITVQGHSLGGAVAVLLAVAIGYSKRVARFNTELKLFTVGQRRVASTAHLERALQCRYIRVQNGSDIACLTPMLPGYGDAGTCLYLPNNVALGPAIVDPSAWTKIRDRLFTGFERFSDHSVLGEYVARLEAIEAGTGFTFGD